MGKEVFRRTLLGKLISVRFVDGRPCKHRRLMFFVNNRLRFTIRTFKGA